jgi:cyclopropane fatty-acyl-phospholipid synthase-like methyltransferase
MLRELRALPLEKGDRVLELGCNDGRYLDTLAALFKVRGVGLDLSERAVRRALAGGEFAAPNDFHVGECERLPFADGAFRCVVAFDVFEHLGHAVLAKTMEECARVLAPGGVMLIYVISQRDRFTLHETVRRVSNGRLGHDDQDGHAYENFVSPALFRTLATQAGLTVGRIDAYHGFWTLYGEEFLGNRLPGPVYRALEWLDFGLVAAEHGNGFFALASKERR